MEITEVRIRIIPHKPRIKAIASVTLDDSLILNDIKVIQANDRLCVDFPLNPYARDKNHREYIVVPMNMDIRAKFERKIISMYKKIATSYSREMS